MSNETLPRDMPPAVFGEWWSVTLRRNERSKLKSRHGLNDPTLKLSDELLKKVYLKELAMHRWQRTCSSRFYKLPTVTNL